MNNKPCWLLEFENGFKEIYSDPMYQSVLKDRDKVYLKIVNRTFYKTVKQCENEHGTLNKYGFLGGIK